MRQYLIACLLLTRFSCEANLDLTYALKFLSSGWVGLPRFLKELESAELRERIRHAELLARLEYVRFAYGWMEREYLTPLDPPLRVQRVCGQQAAPPADRLGTEALNRVVETAIDQLKSCKEKIKAFNPGVIFPYFQSLNVHRLDDRIFELATSKKLGKMAAVLLQEPRVSLYQTAVFLQSKAGGVSVGTSWHRDLNMVPLDTAHMGHVTFWCPLQPLDAERQDSILTFAMGSHRDVSYAHWYPDPQGKDQLRLILEDRYRFGRMSRMEVGDCSAHHGWVFHSAPPQLNGTRMAIAFAYVSSRSRVLPDLDGNSTRNHRPFAREDEHGYSAWISGMEPLQSIEGNEFLPVVYDDRVEQSQASAGQRKQEL